MAWIGGRSATVVAPPAPKAMEGLSTHGLPAFGMERGCWKGSVMSTVAAKREGGLREGKAFWRGGPGEPLIEECR
jgi:hypothetical protein